MTMGIDPGATGWVVMLDGDGRIEWSRELPQDDGGLMRMMDCWCCDDLDPIRVVIERQQPMPGSMRGTVAAFRSGYGYGRILEAVAACSMTYELVRSQDWQRVMLRGERKAKGLEAKRVYTAVAERLWPSESFSGPRGGILDGKAAAALIAEYGRRLTSGGVS